MLSFDEVYGFVEDVEPRDLNILTYEGFDLEALLEIED